MEEEAKEGFTGLTSANSLPFKQFPRQIKGSDKEHPKPSELDVKERSLVCKMVFGERETQCRLLAYKREEGGAGDKFQGVLNIIK